MSIFEPIITGESQPMGSNSLATSEVMRRLVMNLVSFATNCKTLKQKLSILKFHSMLRADTTSILKISSFDSTTSVGRSLGTSARTISKGICRFLKNVCQIWGLNQKMEIFIIRRTHLKPTFFETLVILKCKKKVCAKFFWNVLFLWALQLILVW